MNVKLVVIGMLGVAFVVAMVSRMATGQKTTLGQNVSAADQVSMDHVDHGAWNRLLQTHVNEQGQVSYRTWQASDRDTRALDEYLSTLSRASRTVPASREAQVAFWINAYNAVTIKGILREYPTSSIRNHTAKLVGYNIWKDLLLLVGNQGISLDEIEHQVLRKFGEPRIHFAIVCASHSCPRLLNQAYTAANLEDQLTTNSRAFFANPENFQFDVSTGQMKLSSILKWFGEDFGQDQATRLSTIAAWLPDRAAQDAASANSVRISWLKYDWSLNEKK